MGIFHPDVLKAFSRLIGQYLKTGVTNADELLKRIIKDQKLGKLESAIDLSKLTDEEIAMVQSLINENKRLMKKYELLSKLGGRGALTNEFFDGVELQGSFEFTYDLAIFRVEDFKNVSGIDHHALKSMTTEFEKIANIAGIKDIQIYFSYVINISLRTKPEWAELYGYTFHFIDYEGGPGNVAWTKVLE